MRAWQAAHDAPIAPSPGLFPLTPDCGSLQAACVGGIVSMLQGPAGLQPGMTIADIGAGTGLFLRAISDAVGKRGTVQAVELSPIFRDFLAARVIEQKLGNVAVVSSTDTEIALGPATVDVAICVDVYHHFLFPGTMLGSLKRCLKPGGRLVVIDFHRDPARMVHAKHRGAWAIEHIRADQATFRAEIEAAGFKHSAEPVVHGLDENYVMVFRA